MSDRSSFLATIRANPDDDLARLVFADWLTDRDAPLGDFIRVQIELEPIRDHIDNPHVLDLMKRETELLANHRARWVGSAANLGEKHYAEYGPIFVRGLPERVCVSLDTLLARGEELFTACPTVREVAVHDVVGRGRELACYPHLKHIETLEIADWLPDRDWHALVEPGECIRSVRRFRLWLGDRDAGARHFGWYGQEGPSGWPDSVELVAMPAGISVDSPNGPLDAEGITSQMIENLARPIVRLIKPYERRFPLSGDIGHGLTAGRNDDGDAMLLAVARDGTGCWVHFNEDGTFEDISTFNQIDPTEWKTHCAGLIRVKEFETLHGALSVRLWDRPFVDDLLRNPLERPPDLRERTWRKRGGFVRRWLEEGKFIIEWDGAEFVCNGTGRILA